MSLNVLLVDDQAQDRALVRRELAKHFRDIDFVEVSGPDELEKAFDREGFDLVISDYALGWGDGLRVLGNASRQWPQCGTIMYTGTGNEEVAVAAMKAGFDDYVVKSQHHLKRLPDVARRSLERHHWGEVLGGRKDPGPVPSQSTEDAVAPGVRPAAEEATGGPTALLRLLHDTTAAANGAETLSDALEAVLPELAAGIGWPVAHTWRAVPGGNGSLESSGIWCLFDPPAFDAFRSVTANLSLRPDQGLPGRAVGARAAVWVEDLGKAVDSPRAAAAREARIGAAVAVPVRLDSEVVAVVELFRRQPGGPDGNILQLLDRIAAELAKVEARHRAEKRRAEAQARVLAARKMEAVARLTGGVAHDFNNLLNVVTLEAEDVLGEPDLPPRVRRSLGTILKTAERGGLMIRRLLTFGRRQPGSPADVDVGEMVRDMKHFLGHLVEGRVDLRIHVEDPAARVQADRSQLEQVLVNLVLNARDAMPEGGEVAIGVRKLRVAAASVGSGDLTAGDYVILSVSDTGPGIAPEIEDRIFEPFVSTKRHGPGTGLGLSVCHGFVEEMGGRIRLESQKGKGATFEVVLPANGRGTITKERPSPQERGVGRGESILLVQDEEDLRTVLARVLGIHGYDVMSVARGEEAMEILESGRTFDLIVADVGLPGIQGPELARAARALVPDSAVVLTTGYSRMASHPGKAEELEVDDIVQKPFTLDELLGRLRQALDHRTGRAANANAS